MKRHHRILVICLMIMPLQPAIAADMAGFNFLRTHVGARPAALAGAFTAIDGDLHAIYFNPAGLASLETRSAGATYLNHVLDIQSGVIVVGQHFENVGTVGIGLNYIDYGSFDKTDKNGEKFGTFGANNIVMTATYGRTLINNISAGIGLKYIRSVIDSYSSQAVAADIGFLYHAHFSENLNIGVSILHLGQSTSAFIDTKEDLPTQIVAGFSKKLAHLPLLFNANIYKYVDDDIQFAIGGEFTISEGLFLRLGYNSLGRDQKVGSDYDSITGFSAGFGFHLKRYQLDYAFSSMGEVGSLNRITFSSSF